MSPGDASRYERADVRPVTSSERPAVRALLGERWASPTIVTRARIHDATTIPAFAIWEDDRMVGLITLSVEGMDCELVTIDSLREGAGIGTALLEHAEDWAREQGCDRMWLVTTNDNLRALYFYQRRGFRVIAVHRDAVARCRELKPEIAQVAPNGIPILDELELEKPL